MIDKETAKEIANQYYSEIHSYCLSYAHCTEGEADDITQEVFLTLQKKADTFKDINVRAWLFKTAKNKTREYFRKQNKAEKLVPLNPDALPTDDMYVYIDKYFEDADYVSDEYIEKCKELILKSLNKKEIELYTKVFVEKKKYKQVAEEMNISEKNVAVRVSRLRQKIKTLVRLSLSVVGQVVIKLFFM